jgi:LysM repeat protein
MSGKRRTLLVVAAEAVPVLCIMLAPLSVHAGVLSTMLSMIGTSVIAYEAKTDDTSAADVKLLASRTNPDPNAASGGGDIIVDEGSLVPSGAFGENEYRDAVGSGEISVYTVREGDSLSQIAEMFGVTVNTILWANDVSAKTIHEGQTLVILPIVGVRHVVKEGDTLASIAKKYEGNADEILSYNQLATADDLTVGSTIIIPGGNMHTAPVQQTTKKSSSAKGTAPKSTNGYFSNPLPGSVETQGIHGYNGVDLAGVSVGTPIRAAAAGEVIVSRSSGWNGGYGSYVVVKHGNGTQTLYAHMSSVAVAVGDYVDAGETLGGVGSTGKSTGPHLHFEVRGATNPF